MKCIFPMMILLALAACGSPPDQNRYDASDVGRAAPVVFGTVLSQREVAISGEDNNAGLLAGGVGGGVAGSLIGAGNGSILGALGGVAVGALLGDNVQRDIGNRTGIEYIILLDTGGTQSIVQNKGKYDQPIAPHARVMVQTQGSYHRVLPAPAGSPPAPTPPSALLH